MGFFDKSNYLKAKYLYWGNGKLKLLYRPRYNYIKPLLGCILLYLLMYVVIAISFGFIYHNYGNIKKTAEEFERGKPLLINADTFIDSIYFSLSTQSTLGLGDLTPGDTTTRLLSTIQTFIGLMITAILLGYTLSKIIRPKANITASDYIVYNPDNHYMMFRFWNKDPDNYLDLNINMLIWRHIKSYISGQTATYSFPVKIDFDEYNIPSGRIVRYRTLNESFLKEKSIIRQPPELVKADNKSQSEINEFYITNLEKNDTITINFEGIASKKGDHVSKVFEYNIKDIKCGEFEAILPYRDSKYSSLNIDKNTLEYNNFNRIRWHNSSCGCCDIAQYCPLDKASYFRKKYKIAHSNLCNPKGEV